MKFCIVFMAAAFAALIPVAAIAGSAYSITVVASANTYVGAQPVMLTGLVQPAPGAGTAVLIRVFNPAGTIVAVWNAAVNPTSGSFSVNFTAGGSSAWTGGQYTVNATWGAYGPVIYATTTFVYTPSTTTTTNTTSTTALTTTSSAVPEFPNALLGPVMAAVFALSVFFVRSARHETRGRLAT